MKYLFFSKRISYQLTITSIAQGNTKCGYILLADKPKKTTAMKAIADIQCSDKWMALPDLKSWYRKTDKAPGYDDITNSTLKRLTSSTINTMV